MKEFANMAGVPYSSLRSWHNSTPNVEMALKVADALRVPLEYLATGRETTFPDLTENEVKLLQEFKQLSAEKQKTILLMAHTFAKEEQKKASESSENLNEKLSNLTVN